jgi:two-component system response regulator FixJ
MSDDLPVYVVEDDAAIRRMVAHLIELSGRSVRTFPSAAAFLNQVEALPYGCLLLDIGLPDSSGLDVLASMLARELPWPVVMVSGTTDVGDAVEAFRRGAIHFLRKPFRCEELDRVLAEANAVGLERFCDYERRRQALSIALTLREREVLSAMARGEQTKVIAWSLGLSARTIDMHRGNILTKLSARNASQAVSKARELHLIA